LMFDTREIRIISHSSTHENDMESDSISLRSEHRENVLWTNKMTNFIIGISMVLK
jgi:hypothetical protein